MPRRLHNPASSKAGSNPASLIGRWLARNLGRDSPERRQEAQRKTLFNASLGRLFITRWAFFIFIMEEEEYPEIRMRTHAKKGFRVSFELYQPRKKKTTSNADDDD